MAVVKTYQEEIYSIQMAIVSEELTEEENDYLTTLMESEENFTSRHPKIFMEHHKAIRGDEVDQYVGKPPRFSPALPEFGECF